MLRKNYQDATILNVRGSVSSLREVLTCSTNLQAITKTSTILVLVFVTGRAAGNRTRAARPPASRTTIIRQPAGLSDLFSLTPSFNAGGADFYPLTVDLCPLEIGVFAVAVYRIIMTAQQFALVCHH